MLPTPSTSHVCFDRVYEPAEDSFLLLDTLASPSETSFLHARFAPPHSAPPLILEVGVGSGVVLAFAAANAERILGRADALTLGVDINSFACKAAAQTVATAIREQRNGAGDGDAAAKPGTTSLDVVNADLTTALKPHAADILIFNPPYVPASLPDYTHHDAFNALPAGKTKTSFEQDSYLLELSYAGGEDGMVVTNRLLEQVPGVLSEERGVAYVLLCAQNRPEEVKGRIRAWGAGWKAETVGRVGRRLGGRGCRL